MKLAVFAHTPPPHHGQSYMVQLMLEALGGDARRRNPNTPPATRAATPPAPAGAALECYHINCRLSEGIEDVGQARGGKLFPLLRHCLAAIWLRLRHGVDHFYYAPATACRLGMLRDWIIMALCRPFFGRIICHWHAAGLGVWLRQQARPWERRVSRLLLFRPDLSIVLGEYGRQDGEAVLSKQVVVVPNGIPDPAPEYERDILPLRQARAAERLKAACCPDPKSAARPMLFSVLYLSLCSREKGLFDALEAVALANARLADRRWPIRVQLQVAGTFWSRPEEEAFRRRIQQPDLWLEPAVPGEARQPSVHYLGFVSGDQKRRLLLESDCFCFPTRYAAESFPLVLLEAMAFGLPIVSTRWRHIPEMLPPGYAGLVEPQSPLQVAEALLASLEQPYDRSLRDRFLAEYTRERFAANLAAALRAV